MRAKGSAWTLLLLATLARPGVAQEGESVRQERFTFLGSDLTIEVLVDVPGKLRLIHGVAGEIDVTGRGRPGIVGFGLAGGDRDELRLTAVGADSVEYLVVVPEDVRVRVRLPGRPVAEVFGTTQATATYTWQATKGAGAGGSP
jgi:hypothetical protein